MVGQGTTDDFWTYVLETVRDLSQKSYYDLLGIDNNATLESVSDAYYDLLRRLHPDAHGSERSRIRQRALTRLTARIGEAYRTLSDPRKRVEYDRGLVSGKRRMLLGEDRNPNAGPQDPSSESARKLWEQGLAHLEDGNLVKARAQLVLAKSFEPQSKAIAAAWDRLLHEEHDKLNAKRVARGFEPKPFEGNDAPPVDDDLPEPVEPEDADEEDDDEFPTNPPALASLLSAGIAGPGDGVVRHERAAALDEDDTYRSIDTIPVAADSDATLDEEIEDSGDLDEIAVEVASGDTDMIDADTMFEPLPDPDDPADPTQQVQLESLVAPPLRVRVRTWEQARQLYMLVRDCKGLFIRSQKDAYVAQLVEVEVVLPTEEAIFIEAIVRDVVLLGDATGRKPGLGVEFTGIDDENRPEVERLIPPGNQS